MTWNDTTLGTYGPWIQTGRWGTWHLGDYGARDVVGGTWPAACGDDFRWGRSLPMGQAPPGNAQRVCRRCWAKWERQQAWERAQEAAG